INDLGDTATLAHLFKYDSVHGPYPGTVTAHDGKLVIDGYAIPVFTERAPENLPWKSLGVDVVVEATGKFTRRDMAKQHLAAGAKQVLLSAPSPDRDIPTVVLGINEATIDLHTSILSNASCTTNNLAPLVKVLDENWGIVD